MRADRTTSIWSAGGRDTTFYDIRLDEDPPTPSTLEQTRMAFNVLPYDEVETLRTGPGETAHLVHENKDGTVTRWPIHAELVKGDEGVDCAFGFYMDEAILSEPTWHEREESVIWDGERAPVSMGSLMRSPERLSHKRQP